MRGKATINPTGFKLMRITPAYAGKSPQQEDTRKNQRGSPPPMRGKVSISVPIPFSERITPAYAGKSCYRNLIAVDPRDHPRLCGEKHLWICRLTRSYRITPAYAGKSTTWYRPDIEAKDHPRLCGEKTFASCFCTGSRGSPPPMRGKVIKNPSMSRDERITPAYAGKSKKGLSKRQRNQDHPRLCGEKTKKIPKQRYFFHQPASFSFSLQYT